jgi:hypothetical protein
MDKQVPTLRGSVLSTNKELIPARNERDAHGQHYMANDKAVVPSLAHCTLLEMPDESSLSGTVQLVIVTTNKNSVFSATPAVSRTAPDMPTLPWRSSRDLWSAVLSISRVEISKKMWALRFHERLVSDCLVRQRHIPRKWNPPVQQCVNVINSFFHYRSAEPETEVLAAA